MKNLSNFCGPAVSLLNSGNWNPALHPRNLLGEFIYTDGGLHGRHGPVPKQKKDEFTIYHGIPSNSQTFKTLNGTAFLAPAGADFKAVYYKGEASGLTPWSVYANIWHYGQFDFQRNMGQGYKAGGNTFYQAYTDASNYAVGVYLNGAGFNLQNSLRIAAIGAIGRVFERGIPPSSIMDTLWMAGGECR